MIDLFKKKGYLIYGLLFLLSLLLIILEYSPTGNNNFKNNELFDRNLSRINSITKAVVYNDSAYEALNRSEFDTMTYVESVSNFVKNRFHYGLSNYKLGENWPAYMGGKLIWSHLSAIVEPDDILKHSEGLCSQQTIVFLEILKQKGIPFRSVGLGPKEGPGHFLCEVFYGGDWHIYDITMEPNWQAVANSHNSMNYYMNNKDTLFVVYHNKIAPDVLGKMMTQVNYGKTSEMPGRNMLFFHKACKVLQYLLPPLFIWLCLRSFRRTRRNQR